MTSRATPSFKNPRRPCRRMFTGPLRPCVDSKDDLAPRVGGQCTNAHGPHTSPAGNACPHRGATPVVISWVGQRPAHRLSYASDVSCDSALEPRGAMISFTPVSLSTRLAHQ